MLIVLTLTAAAALATSDLCDYPVKEPSRPEEYGECRLASPRRVDTPYFSVRLDSRFLVSLDQDGRRMHIGFSPRQNQGGLLIWAIPNDDVKLAEREAQGLWKYSQGMLNCERRTLGSTSWFWCTQNRWKEESLPQYYLLRATDNVYYIEHYASGLGREVDPGIEELLQSVIAHGI